MARISLQPPDTPLLRAAKAYSKRMYGDVLQPGLAFAHNTQVLLTYVRFERSLARWNRLDDDLKGLAVMASAATIGCAWCMDFGHWTEHARGMDSDKLQAIPKRLLDALLAGPTGVGRRRAISAARRPINGAEPVIRFLFGLARKYRGSGVELVELNGGPGLVMTDDGTPIATVQLGIRDGRIERIWSMRNPAKLSALSKARRLVVG